MKSKNMHGFLCRSDVSTAVCVPKTTRSVVVPRRPDRTVVDRAMLVDFNSYSHLLESRRLRSATNAGSGEKKRMVVATKRDRTTATIKPKTTTSKKPTTSIPSSLTSTYGDAFQVVIMRVSIHCQGCAGKVKKHISKMEGVTSFSIDLETKKVTVMGNISPVGVLESISKVKKAEFWHS